MELYAYRTSRGAVIFKDHKLSDDELAARSPLMYLGLVSVALRSERLPQPWPEAKDE